MVELRREPVDEPVGGHVDETDPCRGSQAGSGVAVRRRGDDRRGAAVGEHVGQLGVGVRWVQRDGDSAGVPAGEHGGDDVVTGSAQDGDSIAVPDLERAGEAHGVVVDPGERPLAGRVDDGEALAVGDDPIRQRCRSRTRCPSTSGGRRAANPVASSSTLAARSRATSAPWRVTSCTPTGMPSTSNPAGSDSVGHPVTVIRQHAAIQSM